MSSSDKPLCLVTGASAGIGAALASEYARHGWNLALAARREQPMVTLAKELKQAYGTQSFILPTDLSDPKENAKLMARIARKGEVIDGLINNAGYGLPGRYTSEDWTAHQASLNVMLNGPCELVHRVLPGMNERGFGRIINVASLAGYMPGSKGHTTYGAIKSFMIKFSQSLNMEFSGSGINVSALCPGFTYSEFHDVNGTRGAMNKLPKYMWSSAEQVAEAGYIACEANRPVHIVGGVNKSLAALAKILPERAAIALMKSQSEKFRKG